MGFGGSGFDAPPPAPVPPPPAKAEVAKPVTEAATAARTAQKEKSAKSSGIQGSILTSPFSDAGNNYKGKTLLGQ